MSRPLKGKLETQSESETSEERELYLRDGRRVIVSNDDQLVEIRSESGMLELRIKLTEEGPVLQMETVRMQLKATESVSIESKNVEIKATEKVEIKADEDVEVEAKNDVRVNGKMIWLN